MYIATMKTLGDNVLTTKLAIENAQLAEAVDVISEHVQEVFGVTDVMLIPVAPKHYLIFAGASYVGDLIMTQL